MDPCHLGTIISDSVPGVPLSGIEIALKSKEFEYSELFSMIVMVG